MDRVDVYAVLCGRTSVARATSKSTAANAAKTAPYANGAPVQRCPRVPRLRGWPGEAQHGWKSFLHGVMSGLSVGHATYYARKHLFRVGNPLGALVAA